MLSMPNLYLSIFTDDPLLCIPIALTFYVYLVLSIDQNSILNI